LAIVEDDAGASGLCCDEVERGAKRGVREIGDDSQPREERGHLLVEASGFELFAETVMFKVDRGVSKAWWSRDVAGCEEFALPLLGRWVVDFEDVQAGVGIAVGEGVEASSEQDILRDTVGYGLREIVFGVAAARNEESAKRHGKRLVQFGSGAVNFGKIYLAENGNGDRVIEDERRRVIELVRGSAQGYAECSSGRTGWLHAFLSVASRDEQSWGKLKDAIGSFPT
jgi:hypothetical protein